MNQTLVSTFRFIFYPHSHVFPCSRGSSIFLSLAHRPSDSKDKRFSTNRINTKTKSTKMSSPQERTFIMVKPDGVHRGLVSKIIEKFEQKGFKLVAMKFMWASEEHLRKHYADLADKPFFPSLIAYMSSGPVVPMVWEGYNSVFTGRKILGATNPQDSDLGTIRGDYCIQVGRNVAHGSDSTDSATKEINLWFSEKELIDWKPSRHDWVYEG